MTLPVLFLVLLLQPTGPGCAASPDPTPAVTSVFPAPGDAPLSRDLETGEQHRFTVQVDSPSLLVVEVRQRGVDLRLTLADSRQRDLATAAGPGGPWSDELLAAVLPHAGSYCLGITMEPEEYHGGRYLLETIELRPAAPGDETRVEIEREFHAALQEREIPAGGEAAKQRAIEALRRVSDAFAGVGALDRRADALHELGSTLLETNRLEPALAAFRDDRSLRRRLDDSSGEAWALEGIARVLTRRGDFAAALEAIEGARRFAEVVGDPGLLASVDNTTGYVYLQRQDYARAIAPLQRAVSGHRQAGNAREEALALSNLGLALRTTGDDTKRCSAIEESARLLEELRYTHPFIFIYLGDCRQRQGRVDAAMGAYESALAHARAEGDAVAVSYALLYYGGLLAHLGEYGHAQRRIEEARSSLGDGGSADLRTHLDLHLGWLALAQEDPAGALSLFETALDRLQQGGEDVFQRSVATCHRAIGDALIHLGRPREALAHLERAEELSRDAAERRPAEALRKLGVAHMELGDLDKAETYLTQALEEVGGDMAQEGATHSQLARLAMRQGRLRDALDEVEAAIRIRESVRASVAPPSLRASYLARWRDDYGLAIHVLVRLAADAEGPRAEELVRTALTMSERAHSRTLQELLVEARSLERSEVPEDLARRRARNEERLAQLNRRLTSGELTSQEEAAVGRELDDTADELMRIEWEIRDPLSDHDFAPTFDPATLQRQLRPREALLEYFLGTEQGHLFVVTRQELMVFDLVSSAEITRLVELVRSGLAAEQRHLWPRLIEVSDELYGHLIAPAETGLEDVERLIVVPDRELFYLPFESLLREMPPQPYTPDGLASRYLLARWQVGYVPSATVLAQLRPTAPPEATGVRKTLVAFANPVEGRSPGASSSDAGTAHRSGHRYLPGAREEVTSISELMPADNVLVFLGDQATEDRLTTLRQPTRWYHFAVHGLLDQSHPALSGLVLADGELQVHEIYDLELDAELVVLSACETGLGQKISGEELIGLSRAFFYAGVPTVVVSLWRVADRSTAALMVRFYQRLLTGSDPVDALAGAKRSLMRETGWQHPYHWAPFIVLGHPHPTTGRNARPTATPNTSDHRPHRAPHQPGGKP